MIITVQELGKWGGIKVGNEYIKESKFAKGLPKFEVGGTYDIEIKETVSKTDGKTYKNIVAAKVVGQKTFAVAARPAMPKAKVEDTKPVDPAVIEAEGDGHKGASVKRPSKAVAFGRELSDYELLKDRRIGAQGILQAILQSPLYTSQVELLDPTKVDAFIVEKAEFFLEQVKRLSEK